MYRIILLTIMIIISTISVSQSINSHLHELPSHVRSDPSISFNLPSGFYNYFPCNVYSGQNITGITDSNSPVTLMIMSQAQFNNYQSTGVTQALFTGYGVVVDFNVGPLSSGVYYVVVVNNYTGSANVFLSYKTIPIVPYTVHSSPPAPIGL